MHDHKQEQELRCGNASAGEAVPDDEDTENSSMGERKVGVSVVSLRMVLGLPSVLQPFNCVGKCGGSFSGF